jgi:hypothetical protein
MRLKIAGLLTAFLMWDLVAAPAGESALVRGGREFAETQFAHRLAQYATSGELTDQLRSSVAGTLAWMEQQRAALESATSNAAQASVPQASVSQMPAEPVATASPDLHSEAAMPEPEPEPVKVAALETPSSDTISAKDIAGVMPPVAAASAAAEEVNNEAVMTAARSDAAMPSEAAAQAVVLGTDLLSAIIAASKETGADAGYLLHVAVRESGLWPTAKAPTSSASGPYQFVEQTWFQMLGVHGAAVGLEKEVADLAKSSNGLYRPVSAEAGKRLLALRFDARISSLMAAELTLDNAAALKTQLGREATHGELYAAHILGVAGAATLIRTRDKAAGTSAASVLPAAARANRWLFYDGDKARSVAALFDDISRFQSTREVARVCTAGLNFAASQ